MDVKGVRSVSVLRLPSGYGYRPCERLCLESGFIEDDLVFTGVSFDFFAGLDLEGEAELACPRSEEASFLYFSERWSVM